MSKYLLFTLFVCAAISYPGLCQLKHTQAYGSVSNNGLCSSTYILDSLGYFFYEHGCEASSSQAMGTYKILHDTVFFKYDSITHIPFLLNITKSTPENDTTSKLSILTRFGNPIQEYYQKYVVAVKAGTDSSKVIQVENEGKVLINPNKFDSVKLTFLRRYFHFSPTFFIGHNNITITLSLPSMFINHSWPSIFVFGNQSMLLKDDGLYNIITNEKLFVKEE